MIDMNDFRYFMTIVDSGSFTAAGRALGLPTSTLSYRMKLLEEKLGLTLLLRSSRQLALTEAGAEFYRYALVTVERADEAISAMRDRIREPSGPIRYTTAIATAQFVMPKVIRSFFVKYPQISLVEHAADHFVDIVGERFDLAIRAHSTPLPDSNLIQKRLARIPWQLFASPAYLAEKGVPKDPAELANHTTLFVRRDNTQPRWSLTHQQTGETADIPLSPRLASSCIKAIQSAAKADIGVASLPVYLCRQEIKTGQLVAVLPEWRSADAVLTALMPTRSGMGAGLRAFVDHVALACQTVIDGS
ncbi:LysR family transcriptional regulator [Rhizobium sp. P38BS-XIX]|uniref:LysR substrate-binding domain-containing protein n=1 Tax=Rhizobium sp. P38BS-XIX TaxID=2726740 RepID=UPI0014577447|nr:LysR substrate-binding domain-containing protein [Rhizobium sp. P38BS-XIX]NLS01503.1 LysR family transcriptional regulator [Rhizobium sp. P38BS-XIX]